MIEIPRSWRSKLVEVVFEDHAQDHEDGIWNVVARGRLFSIGRKKLRLIAWEGVDDPGPDADSTYFDIIRSAILSVSLLKVYRSNFAEGR